MNAPEALRALVIDDEPLVLRAIHRLLAAQQIEVVCASSALEAEPLLGSAFDVVLCDQGLGQVDGETVLASVKERSPRSRRILISGARLETNVGEDEVVQAVLEKPFSSAALLDLLAAART